MSEQRPEMTPRVPEMPVISMLVREITRPVSRQMYSRTDHALYGGVRGATYVPVITAVSFDLWAGIGRVIRGSIGSGSGPDGAA